MDFNNILRLAVDVTSASITIQTLLKFAAAITAIGAATGVLVKLFKPISDLKKTVAAHTASLELGNRRFENISVMQRQLCLTMIALVDHEVSGNSVDKLKKARDDLDKAITDQATINTKGAV